MSKRLTIQLNSILLIVFALCMFGQEANAQSLGTSQSYFITDTGRIHTVRSYQPTNGLIELFSPDGFFILPEMMDTAKGSYFLDKDGTIYTVDSDGYVYTYDYDSEVDSKITDAGDNFFITRNDTLHIVRSSGLIDHVDKDHYELDSNIKAAGGNFIVTRKGSVYIVNSILGNIKKTALEIKVKEIEVLGGNYLITKENKLITFGITNSGSVQIKTQTNYAYSQVRGAGGNYFFDRYNKIHTISIEGLIKQPTNFQNRKSPSKLGSNYFTYGMENEFYIIDSAGDLAQLNNFDGRILYTTR